LVMTLDGSMRYALLAWGIWYVRLKNSWITSEYDLAVDAEEPRQTLNFVPQRNRRKGFMAVDEASEQIVSFCLGKSKADWSSLTVYALARSGDVYAICPFMPSNA
jgi:nucleoporin NUP82